MIGAFFIKRTGNYSYTEDVQSGSGIAYLAEKKGSAIQFGMELDFIRLRKTMVSAGPIFSTVGGKLFLGKATNIFIADVNNSQTTIDVKYNNLTNGDRIYLDANSNIEWMAITSSATPITGGYRYSVTRNLDGSGANSWYSGDNIFNTGAAGEGFIDIYATQSIKGASQPGPTMVGNIRNSTTYNDFSEHWAVGNLNGLYGYNTTTFGAAFGKYAAGVPNITIDSTNGIRFRNYTTQLAQWDASGNILIGEVGANKSNIYITSGAVKLRNNATDFIVLNADGSATFAGSITSTATITGGTFQTASSGKRIVLDGATNSLKFYDSNGSLGAELSGVDGQLSLGAYQIVGFRVYDGVSYSNQMNSDQIYIWKYTSPTPSTFYGCMLSSTELKFGAGSDGYYGTLDVNLYRGAANVLKTDDALHIAAGLFQVDINGDITKLKNLAYSWPSSHVAGYLKNNGSGTLTWEAAAGGITSLNGLTGATQTFVNDTNVTIVSSGTTHTITWSGTLSDARITSAATWNAKESALTFSYPLSRSVNTISLNYNATNLQIASNSINTIQDIATASSPTFANLTLTGAQIYASGSNLTLRIGSNNLLPYSAYAYNIGSLTNKFLALHAAELWVETLVAQNTLATIGGRILVADTTPLIADVNDSQTTIDVKYNNLSSGDRIILQANGSVEWMAITSGATPISGGYRYSVTRNLDGSGANNWYAGDAIVNTGAAGEGFIDIYSINSVRSATEYGPTITGYLRNSTTYNDYSEAWAIGNLNGLYGYSTTTFGAAFGKYAAGIPNITIDSTNGIRIRNYTTQLAQWDASGNILIGEVGANKSNIYITSGAVKLRNNTTDKIVLNADGTATFAGSITSTATITGGTIQTASSGNRIVLDGATSTINLYHTSGAAGSIYVVNDPISIQINAASYGNVQITGYGIDLIGAVTANSISVGSTKFTVDTNGDITKLKNLAYAWPSSHVAGYLKNNGSGTLTWEAAAGGITSLNGLTGATQTFVNDTNVTIVSSGTTHTITWSGTLSDARITSAATWNAKESALTFSYPLSRSVNTISLNYNATNLQITSNSINTIQDIATASSPTFANLTLTGAQIYASGSNLTLRIGSNNLLPYSAYAYNIGSLTNKFLALHAAELWVETLVAQNTLATIGGRILVADTTPLIADVNDSQTTIDVKYNNLSNGDRIILQANGSVEWMAITSSATPISGGYRYSVTRNLDGSGANNWYAGDAVVNTGTAGEGFIDIYSINSVRSATEYGPTITGYLRNSATYNDYSEAWAVGNLNGLYGYSTTTFGAAFGKYAAGIPNITIDSTNGIRFRNYTTQLAQWDASGNILIGEVASGKSNIYITSGAVKLRNNVTDFIVLNADGSATFAGNITSTATITGGTIQNSNDATTHIMLDTNGLHIGRTDFTTSYESSVYTTNIDLGTTSSMTANYFKIIASTPTVELFRIKQLQNGALYHPHFPQGFSSTGYYLNEGQVGSGTALIDSSGNINVGTITAATSKFTVDSNGDITKLKDLTYAWPSSHVAGYLKNNGSGTLTWTAIAVTDLTAITASKIAVTDASGFLAASSVASSTLFTPAYGEMYDNGSLTAIGIDAEWGVWSGSTTGDCSSNVTYNAAADKLTVSDAGVYEVSFTISFYTDFTNEVLWAIWKNGIASGTELVKSKTAYGVTSGITYTAVGKCYVSLSANDYIVLAVYYGNAGTITTRLGNVSLRKISN